MNSERDIREIERERLHALIEWADAPDRVDLSEDLSPDPDGTDNSPSPGSLSANREAPGA